MFKEMSIDPNLMIGVFFCLLFTGSYSALSAQEVGFKGNVMAGLATSQISGDGLAGFDKVGAHFAVGVSRSLNEKWQLAMDISFIQKGSRKIAKPNKGDFNSYLMALDYAEVPIYVVYQQDKWGFELGTYVGYLLKAREEDQNGEINRIGREYKGLDIGGLVGLRYPLNEQLLLNIRLSNSLFPVREHAGNAVMFLNRGQYNSVLGFGIRYKFRQ